MRVKGWRSRAALRSSELIVVKKPRNRKASEEFRGFFCVRIEFAGPSQILAKSAFLGVGEALVDLVPVDGIPPGFEVVGALVLVLEVVGVLPHIVA